MFLDQLELCGSESPGTGEYFGGDTELADVVDVRGEGDAGDRDVIEAQPAGHRGRQAGDAALMAGGIGFIGFPR